MSEPLAIIAIGLLVLAIVLLIVLLQRRPLEVSRLQSCLEIVQNGQERAERSVKEEMARNREEGTNQARGLRGEVSDSLKKVSDLMEIGRASCRERV